MELFYRFSCVVAMVLCLTHALIGDFSGFLTFLGITYGTYAAAELEGHRKRLEALERARD